MKRNVALKVAPLLIMVTLCANLHIVNSEKIASPTTCSLWSVSMVGTDDGWALGDSGTIIHWNGTKWNIVTSPTKQILRSVFMTNPNDGWAAGYGGAIIHWAGAKWISEFPIATLMPILLILTLVAVILARNVKETRKCARAHSSANLKSSSLNFL